MAKMHNGDCPECGLRWRVREPATASVCPQCGFLVDAHRLQAEMKLLQKAATAMVAWFDAEKKDTGTFWEKADLCKYAEWAARKALGQDVGEFEGIPRLFLVHTNAAGEIPKPVEAARAEQPPE